VGMILTRKLLTVRQFLRTEEVDLGARQALQTSLMEAAEKLNWAFWRQCHADINLPLITATAVPKHSETRLTRTRLSLYAVT